MPRSPLALITRFRDVRVLTTAEYAWAQEVFGDTLPPRAAIHLSAGIGLHRRPFTFPWFGGRITLYLGRQQPDPVRTAPALFAHELTHVWQIHHAAHRLPWLARAIVTQTRNSLGHDVYAVGEAVEPWGSYSIEQQATVVEHWYAHRRDAEGRRLQHYVDDHVRSAGQPKNS